MKRKIIGKDKRKTENIKKIYAYYTKKSIGRGFDKNGINIVYIY